MARVVAPVQPIMSFPHYYQEHFALLADLRSPRRSSAATLSPRPSCGSHLQRPRSFRPQSSRVHDRTPRVQSASPSTRQHGFAFLRRLRLIEELRLTEEARKNSDQPSPLLKVQRSPQPPNSHPPRVRRGSPCSQSRTAPFRVTPTQRWGLTDSGAHIQSYAC